MIGGVTPEAKQNTHQATNQETPVDCHLCGWVEGDCIEHYIHCEELISSVSDFLPNIGWKFGPVEGTLRSMLCIEMPSSELVATVVTNDLLVTTPSAINLSVRSLPLAQLLFARLRALARGSATIRTAVGGLDYIIAFS